MTYRSFIARNARRWFVAFVALCGLQVAHAINKGQMGSYRYTPSGNSVSISPNQAGSSGTLAGVTPISTGGNIGTPIGATGWYHGGNAPAGSTTGQTMHMVHGGEVFFAGTKYPFQAGYQVPKSAILDGLGMLCKNPVICLGLSFAAPAITEWLNKGEVGINGNEADYPQKPFLLKHRGEGLNFRLSPAFQWRLTREQACADGVAVWQAVTEDNVTYRIEGNTCWRVTTTKTGAVSQTDYYLESKVVVSLEDMPASLDDIAPYMDKPEVTPNVVRDLLDQGAEVPLPSKPTVTGPSQIKGPVTTTTNSDGTTTTRQTVNNYRTDGNTITNTSTVTITNTCTGAGACSRTTDETKPDPDSPDDERRDDNAKDTDLPDLPKLYERKYPDGMTGIWKQKKDQFSQTSMMTFAGRMMPTGFTAGTCPNWRLDLSFSQRWELGTWDVSPPCWVWDVAGTIILVSALILARALVFGG